jgi:hypothetical protein
MENRMIEYRKMSDKKLEQEEAYLLHQIGLTMQRIQLVCAMLPIGQKSVLNGSKLIKDLEIHYRQLEAVTEEKQFRIIV